MELPKLVLSKSLIRNFERAKRLEWIVTNGMGCYASSTIFGMNTRKYHGLLIASKNPPMDRKVLLSKLEEEIEINGRTFSISTNRYIDIYHPKGYEFLESFTLNPFPSFIYKLDDVLIKKTVFMPRLRKASVVMYDVSSKKKITLRVRPLVNFRSIYSLTKSFIPLECESAKDCVVVRKGKEDLIISSKKARFVESNLREEERWYKNFYYEVDAERGEDCVEHNYNPGYFEISGRNFNFSVVSSFCEYETIDIKREYKREIGRLKHLLENFFNINKIPKEDWIKWLVIASDKHVIKRYDGRYSVIAGYHWFGEWGRDAMISLPGLCLATGRYEEGKGIIKTFLDESKDGVAPNRLARSVNEENLYNSVDAGLWLINAVYLYFKATGDLRFVKNNWKRLKGLINAYIDNMNTDFLIKHKHGTTWMDVKVDGKPVTPREKAVEVQALWYNALRIMEFFSIKLKDRNAYRTYSFIANKVKDRFVEKFWNGRYLNDAEGDKTLRPNQIIALSLPFKVINDKKKVKSILKTVEEHLLTRYGLRTLEKDHPNFHPVYSGSLVERDLAYHQGTIWPWLTGEFIKAIPGRKKKEFIENVVKPFVEEEIRRFGLGTIAEIIDGDEPFESKGCISQAWSIAKFIEGITSL